MLLLRSGAINRRGFRASQTSELDLKLVDFLRGFVAHKGRGAGVDRR